MHLPTLTYLPTLSLILSLFLFYQGRRRYIEDMHSIVFAEHYQLFAVFDGHFGSAAARFTSKRLHALFEMYLSVQNGDGDDGDLGDDDGDLLFTDEVTEEVIKEGMEPTTTAPATTTTTTTAPAAATTTATTATATVDTTTTAAAADMTNGMPGNGKVKGKRRRPLLDELSAASQVKRLTRINSNNNGGGGGGGSARDSASAGASASPGGGSAGGFASAIASGGRKGGSNVVAAVAALSEVVIAGTSHGSRYDHDNDNHNSNHNNNNHNHNNNNNNNNHNNNHNHNNNQEQSQVKYQDQAASDDVTVYHAMKAMLKAFLQTNRWTIAPCPPTHPINPPHSVNTPYQSTLPPSNPSNPPYQPLPPLSNPPPPPGTGSVSSPL